MSQNSGPTTKSTPPPLPAPDTPPPLPMPEKEKKSGCNGCLYKFFGGLILLGVFGAVLEEMDPEKEEATQAAPETAVEHAVQLKEIAEKETPESTPSPQASANMTRTPSAPLPAKKKP